MSERYVITISREFASMGRTIAQNISEQLRIPFYDRDIVEEAAKNLNMSLNDVSELEESADHFLYRAFPLGTGKREIQDKIYEAQKRVILDFVSVSSCIIVGRCADAILADLPNAVHIHIYTSYDHKFENCIKNLHMNAKEAEKIIKQVDIARSTYHKKYAGFAPDDVQHKDILIDSSLLGVEETANYLTMIIRKRFNL